MARATQLLAYHGRTALLLGPMPRRANMVPANLPGPVRTHATVTERWLDEEVWSPKMHANRLHSILTDVDPQLPHPVSATVLKKTRGPTRVTEVAGPKTKRRIDGRGKN